MAWEKEMKSESRRTFLKTGLLGSILGYISTARADYLSKLNPTPAEIKGPFYPITPQKDKDFDLTQVEGRTGTALGKIIWIEGQILDTEGATVEDASVELWQANTAGRYQHPHDKNPAPLDPNFQGWAIVPSGKNGAFRFQTIMPGAYPASESWTRPPHIHFKISKLGYVELITQMYFPGNALNDQDLLLKRKGAEEQKLMIALKTSDNPETYRFQMVLQLV